MTQRSKLTEKISNLFFDNKNTSEEAKETYFKIRDLLKEYNISKKKK